MKRADTWSLDAAWQLLGLGRQTGVEYWPGDDVQCQGQRAAIVCAVSTPRIVITRDAHGFATGSIERAVSYDVRLASGAVVTGVAPANLERDELWQLLMTHDCRFHWDDVSAWCLAGPREGEWQWKTASFTAGDVIEAKRAAIEYLKHEHSQASIRPARRERKG